MATKTVTDRVSVRVSNSDDTDKKKQQTDSAKNIANALGGSISDELAEEIGESLGDTVVDENGNEWVPMSDFIAAGKKMYENGAFDEKEVHEGLTDSDGTVYNLAAVYSTPLIYGETSGMTASCSSGSAYIVIRPYDSTYAIFQFFSKEYFEAKIGGSNATAGADTVTINNTSYSFFTATLRTNWGSGKVTLAELKELGYIITDSDAVTQKAMAGYLFGPVYQSSSSLIDWTKSDEELEKDIKELHETWDITEHSAAGEDQDLTCCLAGPIEYN